MEATADETVRWAIAYARSALVEPGDWLTGRQRRAAWLECRDARGNELDQARKLAVSPNAVEGSHAANDHLSAAAVEVLHRITSDPGRLTRAWANEVMSTLGDAMYTELVSIAATVASVDAFDNAIGDAIGDGEAPVPEAVDGDPARVRPNYVGDVGPRAEPPTGRARGRADNRRARVLLLNDRPHDAAQCEWRKVRLRHRPRRRHGLQPHR